MSLLTEKTVFTTLSPDLMQQKNLIQKKHFTLLYPSQKMFMKASRIS